MNPPDSYTSPIDGNRLSCSRLRGLFLPMVAALFSLLATAQGTDSIPFLYRGHLYVPAVIENTHHANVIFDTGAADMFGVDSVYLLQSDWRPEKIGQAIAGGGAGQTRVKIIIGPSAVSIGSIDSEYEIVPVFKLRDVVDCHVDGIWGIKDITESPFEINFEHHYLKRYGNSAPDLDGYEKLPIRYEDDRILLQAEVVIGDKSVKGWYLMDTGSCISVDFTAGAVREFGIEELPGKRYVTDVAQFGLGAKAQESIIEMQSRLIVIGSDTIPGEGISYMPEGTGAFSDRDYIAIIGNDVWDRFNIVIDAKQGFLYLKRFKENPPQKPTYDYGFRNRTDIGQGWIVSSLTRDGKAANAVLRLGDRITAVNGKPVENYTWEEEADIGKMPEQILDVIGADGTTKQIMLTPELMW